MPAVGLVRAWSRVCSLWLQVILRSVQLQGQMIFEEHFVCPGCCGWCGFCFVLLEGPALSVSSHFAPWRAWTWQLWCWHLQELFSSFYDGRRPSRQWLWGLCMSCAFHFNITLPSKLPKHSAFSLSHGLLPLNRFLGHVLLKNGNEPLGWLLSEYKFDIYLFCWKLFFLWNDK